MSSMNSRGARASINGGGSSIASSNEEEQTTSSKKNLHSLRSDPLLPSMLTPEQLSKVKCTLTSAEAGIFSNYNANPSPRYPIQTVIKRNTTKVLEKACSPKYLSVEIGLLSADHVIFPNASGAVLAYNLRLEIKEAESLVLRLVETCKLISNDLAVYDPQMKDMKEYQEALVHAFENHAQMNNCIDLFLRTVIREVSFFK